MKRGGSRIGFAVARVVIAVAITAAIVGQLQVSTAFWQSRGVADIWINYVNFFSFFTVESNALAAIVMIVCAIVGFSRRDADPEWLAIARACVVAYMVTTGIVYNLLLRGIELPQGSTLPWSNEVLHVIAPLYLLIDWLVAPGRRPLRARVTWIVIAFPLAWAVYTLVRGPLTPDQVYGAPYWYPYPFLNPNLSPNGYLSVTFYVILIAAVISLVAAGVLWLSRRGSAVSAPHSAVGR